MEKFETKLRKWAEKVVFYCNPIAYKINRAYYVFQSPPREKPKVLLLGLNPGGKTPYRKFHSEEDHCTWNGQCESWNLTDGMTVDALCQQNPSYKGGEKYNPENEWNILKKLKVMISVSGELETCFENMVYINLLYFSSVDFSDFQKCIKSSGNDWKQIYAECVNMTKELIFDIIKPEIIICLGIGNCFHIFRKNESAEVEQILPGKLHKCKIRGIEVYGTSHPAARISNKLRRQIGILLSNNICGTGLPSEEVTTTSFTPQDVLEYFRKNAGKLSVCTNIVNGEKTLRYNMKGIDDEILELQVTSAAQGYIGIRKAACNRKSTVLRDYPKILFSGDYCFSTNASWIAIKKFKDYNSTSVEEVVEKIFEDIRKFQQECQHIESY